MTRASPTDVVLWFVLATAWSSSYAVIKIGIETVDPMVLVAGRMAIAAMIILSVFFSLGHRLSSRVTDWMSYGVTGLLGSVVPFLLITYGEQSVDSALAAILMGFSPIATAILASWTLPDEPLTMKLLTGLFGGVLGVALLVGPDALVGLGKQLHGQIAILGASLCYAASTVYIRRYVRRPALEMAAGSSIFGTLAIGAAVFLFQADIASSDISLSSLWAVIYLGVISTAGANLTYFYLVPRLGATRMSQVNFAVPVGGALFGAVFLSEAQSLHQVGALAIIVGSVWLATTGIRKVRQEGDGN